MGSDDVRYYRISPRFWNRAEQKGWTDDMKMLALYLLTCPHRTTEGLYRLPKQYAQADLEWSPERFGKPFAQLLEDGFCDYDEQAQVVLIRGALRYQACPNENVAIAAVKRLHELPETRLTREFRQLAEQFDERLAKQLPKQFGDTPTPSPALSPTPSPALGDAEASQDAPDPEPPPDPQPPTPRKRDELWEAVLATCQWQQSELTKSARGAANRAVKDLRDVGASPDDIAPRAAEYRRRWPNMSLTPTALAKNWAELGSPAPAGGNGSALKGQQAHETYTALAEHLRHWEAAQ